MKWRTDSPAVLEKTVDEISKQTIQKTRETPRIVNITYYIGVEFLLLEEPVMEYEAFFSENRSLRILADEKKRSHEKFNMNLEDVELPPDAD
jgi:hypothetical protein